MKTINYSWKILLNLITIIIVLAVFSIASTNFETAVLSALVLIYISISSFFSLWGINQMEVGEALHNEFSTIKKLINNNNIKEENEENGFGRELEKDRAEKKGTAMVKFYINSVANIIIFIIAILYLLSAL